MTETGSPRDWTRDERDQFWTVVRGRMAELGIEQAELAEALSLDRSSATRRLRPGGVMTRPTRAEVDTLVRLLRLDAARTRELMALAHYVEAGGEARLAADVDRPRHAQGGLFSRPWPRRIAWLLAAVALALVALVTIVGPGWGGPTARITEPAAGTVLRPGPVTVRGVARGVAAGSGQRLWLVVRDEGVYRPQARAVPDPPAAEWSATAVADEATAGTLDLLVALAGPEADRRFAEWVEARGRGERLAPLLSLPADATALDSVQVSVSAQSR